jgi:hypothetical protein
MKRVLILCVLALFFLPCANAEFRSAQDMAKECRVALDLLQNHIEKSSENALLAGECIGYVQAATDGALALGENTSWYKVCVPDDIQTTVLIQKFIAFVDKNPKYNLASTAMTMMLASEYACPKK